MQKEVAALDVQNSERTEELVARQKEAAALDTKIAERTEELVSLQVLWGAPALFAIDWMSIRNKLLLRSNRSLIAVFKFDVLSKVYPSVGRVMIKCGFDFEIFNPQHTYKQPRTAIFISPTYSFLTNFDVNTSKQRSRRLQVYDKWERYPECQILIFNINQSKNN